MHTIRNDTAFLLQTVYLAEIGIQSLQDYDKGGVSGSSTFPSFMLDLSNEEPSEGSGNEVREKRGGVMGGAEALNSSGGYEESPAKRRQVLQR